MIIQTNNLTKVYKLGEYQIRAVDNVNLEVDIGDFIAIIGPSGSGKTTLLNLIGCIDRPTYGSILIEGEDVSKLPDNKLTKIRLKKIGFVFQTFNLLPNLTAIENVILPMELNNIKRNIRKDKATELLNLVGLSKRINHRPYQLSAGEQQRVGIARALANSPAIVLADEPTGNLDTKTSIEIIELFTKLNKQENKTIIIVTHDLTICDYIEKKFQLIDGKLIVSNTQIFH